MTRTRRQSRRQSDFENAVEDTESAEPTPPARQSFTADDMASIMATLQQTQTTAFERLLDRVLSHESSRESSSPMPAAAPSPAAASTPALHLGNFALCKARFSGAPDDSLDNFIDAMESYKECARVGDDNALRGLSMLVTGDAAVWWQGIKSTITSWSDAVTSLRSAFGDSRPPHRIYMELFSMSQGPSEKTEIFVARARVLLARLPPGDVTEKVQLDMLYGLIHRRVRERLRRDEVDSFDTLLRKARQVEDATDESANEFQHRRHKTTPWSFTTTGEAPARKSITPQPQRFAPTTPRDTRGHHTSSASGPHSNNVLPSNNYSTHSNNAGATARLSSRDCIVPAPRPAVTDVNTSPSLNKNRYCVYCKRYGHLRDECFRLKQKSDNNDTQVVVPTCYGCNEKGVTRSQCKKCNSDYYAVDVAWSDRSTGKIEPWVSSLQCTKHDSNSSASLVPTTSPPSVKSTHVHKPKQTVLCDYGFLPAQFKAVIPTLFCNERRINAIDYVPTDFIAALPGRFFGMEANAPRSLVRSCNSRTRTCKIGSKIPTRYFDRADAAKSTDQSRATTSKQSRVTTSTQSGVTTSKQNRVTMSKQSRVTTSNKSSVSMENWEYFSTVNPNDKSVFLSDSIEHQVRLRPTLSVQILGVRGKALLDSGAKSSVAGALLYELLLKHNHPCEEASRRVRLADGSARTRQVLLTTLEVRITPERSVTLEFTIFPDAQNNETLFGMDFLVAAGIVLDFASSIWHFSGTHVMYPIEYESSRLCTSLSAADILRDDEGLMLAPDEKQQLADLLQHNGDVFAAHGDPTPYAEHHIETGDHAPISVPPYRLTPAKKELMKTELDKMLEDGIIEECESAWTSPAVLVPKKDGKIRFCVDYRRLNAVTKTDAYPMPLIDDLVQSTKRNCFMSTLDLRSGFWQVVVKECDKDKTAFQTPFGTYRFNRMPFGLKNAPSTFQRLIDKLRSSLNRDLCQIEGDNVTLLAYQDDLLLITETYSGHIAALCAVFDKLRAFNLRAKREKCVFCRKTVKYLGHVITQDGVSPDYDKVQAVVEMKPPLNLKHLRTYLQTCSWFRKFVPNFSAIAEPLTRLTKKNQPWIWESEQAHAFEELKKRLTSAPILVQADYSQPFILRTDASNYALGAVLLQGEGAEERPLEYASRLLTSAEKNYSTTEREALAVVWAVERFRGYIDGHQVIVRSDHQPLKWLLTVKSPSGRLVRWALKLQSFNITYQYTPGKANVVADTLSRPTCTEEDTEECGLCSVIVNLPSINPADLRAAQLEDPDIQKIIQDLEDPDEQTFNRWLERGYVLSHGVLYRYDPDFDSEESQLVVPASMRDAVLKELHDSPTAGHQGVERTLQRLRERYYFPGMRRYVTDYLKRCVECLRYKPSNQKPAGLLQTPVLQQRGEVLAIDLFGPLPAGDQGERWVFLIEDVATRWVELFALVDATAETCSRVLLEEYFLRYGLPRRVVSDNGTQFVSAVMQQCMHLMGVKQELIPLYHPEANPAERKNRDLKLQLSILVKTTHTDWPKHLAHVRFAMNSAVCSTTGKTPAFLTFARELRTPFDVHHDLRSILDKENFVPQVTPYLRTFISSLSDIRERVEKSQDIRKEVADVTRRKEPKYKLGDLVLVKTHDLSNASKGVTRKFMPRRDGPYHVKQISSPTTFVIADNSNSVIGKYHSTDLTPFTSPLNSTVPIRPKGRRGRPRRRVLSPKLDSGRVPNLEGECIARNTSPSPDSDNLTGPCRVSDVRCRSISPSVTSAISRQAREIRRPARYCD